MSIYYSGTLKRSAGVLSAIQKQLKLLSLKPVKRIQVQFDPFHPNALTAREFLFHITTPKVQETNLNCILKTNVVCDRSEPEIKIDLGEAGKLKFLINNLTVLEVFQQLNKHVSPLIKTDEVSTNVLRAKIQQKVQKKR